MEYLTRTEYTNTLNIHLNRPKFLNTLNIDTIAAIRKMLSGSSKTIVFTSEGRAFCAGGDILEITIGGRSRKEFTYKEYCLIHNVASIPQNTVAVLDGITMGGGVGLSIACSHRILTQKTIWAMPEIEIGMIADAGSSFFLNHLLSKN